MGTESIVTASLATVAAALERAASAAADTDDWVALQAIWTPLVKGRSARPPRGRCRPPGQSARGNLAAVFEQRFHELWLASVIDESPILGDFRRGTHRGIGTLQGARIGMWIEATQSRLSEVLRTRRPALTGAARRGSKAFVLENEIRKKRRHMPLRRLFHEAGEVVQAIKPCFMMSPVSVAQYLAPGGPMFDVVIFDEASQVEPADAFGAIARGRQVLLVGDEKQLPPTAFFTKVESDEGDAGATADNRMTARRKTWRASSASARCGLPHRFSLRWHYRSRHETLIAFSNQHFYDQSLRIFPSAHTGRDEAGVQLRYVGRDVPAGEGPHQPGGGAEHRRRGLPARCRSGPTNRSESEPSTNRKSRPSGTSSSERRRARARRTRGGIPRPSRVRSRSSSRTSENIQGDERDVILLSVTYGPDATGRVFGTSAPSTGRADGGD